MPVIFEKKIESSVSVCVWQITETEDFFWQLLTLSSADRVGIQSCRLLSRRLEKLACRAALAHILKNNIFDISYSTEGQPLIAGYHISFSHSRSCAAVAVSPTYSVGIDIEPIQDRILKLYSKFLNDSEINEFDVADKTQLHLCWGAKEALLKCCSGKVHDFKKHISIAYDSASNLCAANVFVNCQWKSFPLFHFEVEQQMLVVSFGNCNPYQ